MGKKVGSVIGILGGIFGMIGGTVGLIQYVQSRTPTWSGTISQQQQRADDFVHFLLDHDGQTVKLNVTCEALQSDQCFLPPQMEQNYPDVDPVQTSFGPYWLHLDTSGSNAENDNGSYGAGSYVLKGAFEVNVRGVYGDEPPNVQNIVLKGV